MRRTMLLLGVALAFDVAACARAPIVPAVQEAPPPTPPPISAWPGALAAAVREVNQGKYDAADVILARYAMDHRGSDEGAEADFWRALIRLDPFNTRASVREALASFDSYLNAGQGTARYEEAKILRRALESLDSSRAQLSVLRTAAESRDRARDDEIRKLGDELGKTMAELDRIRRRLAQKP